MFDILIKRGVLRPSGGDPSPVAQQAGGEASKEKSRLERIGDQFKKIEIPELLKSLKAAITNRGSVALPASVIQQGAQAQDPLERSMVERFVEKKPIGETLPFGQEVYAKKSEEQCYQMLERRLAPYTEARKVHARNILKAIHRGLYRKGDVLFADLFVKKGERVRREKMTRISLAGMAREKALEGRINPGEPVPQEVLSELQQGPELSYLALSHKVVRPELAPESEVARAELARAKAQAPEKADRGRFSFSVRAEGMATESLGTVTGRQPPVPSPVIKASPSRRWLHVAWIVAVALVAALAYLLIYT